MRWLAGVCCVGALVAGSAAHGADFDRAARTAAPTSWTGFYAGVGLGGRSTAVSWDTVGFNTPGFGFGPFAADNFTSLGRSDARVSGYGGVDYQLGRWVIGLEGDFGTSTNRQSAIGIAGTGIGFATLAGSDTSQTTFEATWDASLRGRLGVLVAPHILFYGTGGVAFQRVKETLFCTATANADGCFPNNVTATADATLTGWTAGGGIEAAIRGNWLLRGEYRYSDYGRFTRNFALGPTSFLGDVTATTKLATHTAVFGLAYKFGAPVGATFDGAIPVKALLAAMHPTWTGFHVGLAAGARRTDAQWVTESTAGLPPFADNTALIDDNAFRYGTYVGYDQQLGDFVAGLEGAFGDAVNARRMHIGVPGLGGTLPGFGDTDSVTVTSNWDASFVGRLGLLIAPDTLIYGLGGAAVENVRINAVCGSAFTTITAECFFDHAESVSTTRTGWIVGSGIETMFAPHWLARFDYRYADLGTIHHTFFVSEPIDSPAAAIRVRTHTASFGIAYKFGPGL